MCGIYKITNLITGKVYIGQSVDILRRWRQHKHSSFSYPLYEDFKKYGLDNFSFEVLEECQEDELNAKEKEYIQKYNSFTNGYNQTIGGSGIVAPVKLTEEDILEIYNLLANTSYTQRNIAKIFDVGEDTISEINTGKTRRHSDWSYPIRAHQKPKVCPYCGEIISTRATACRNCRDFLLQKVARPSREELKSLIREKSFLEIGRMFGVSDNAIRKWCDKEGLPRKKNVIKKFSDEEWEAI